MAARALSGGQIAALIFGLVLLVPGGCFLFFGVGMLTDTSGYANVGPPLLLIGLAIAALAGFLLWIAFRRRNASAPTAPPGEMPPGPAP